MPHIYYVNRWSTIYTSLLVSPVVIGLHLAIMYIPWFRKHEAIRMALGQQNGGGQSTTLTTSAAASKKNYSIGGVKSPIGASETSISQSALEHSINSSSPTSQFIRKHLHRVLIIFDSLLSTFLVGCILWLGISEVAVDNWNAVFGLFWCLGWCLVWFLDVIRYREVYGSSSALLVPEGVSSSSNNAITTTTTSNDASSANKQAAEGKSSHSPTLQSSASTLTKRSIRFNNYSSSSNSSDDEADYESRSSPQNMSSSTNPNNNNTTTTNNNWKNYHSTENSASASSSEDMDPNDTFLLYDNNHHKSRLHWSLWYFETVKLGIQKRLLISLPLFAALFVLAAGATLLVEHACLCIHPKDISSRITRLFQGPSCQRDEICFNYLTLPEDPSHEMIIKFHANNVPEESKVYYDTVPHYANTMEYKHSTLCRWIDMRPYIKDEDRFIHSCGLTNLSPNTTYYFVTSFVDKETEEEIVHSREMKFKTIHNSETEPVRFAISGDRQSHSTISKALLHQATLQDISFFAIGGDLVYDNGMIHCYRRWDAFFREYEAYGNYNGYYIPLLTSIGNHEGLFWQFGVTPMEALNYVQMISHKVGDTGLERRLNHIHRLGAHSTLAILDSGIVQTHKSQVPWMHQVWGEGSKYASTNKMVAYHAPIYPSSRDFTYVWGSTGREYWEPVFNQYNVSVVFEHHDHLFKRSRMMRDGEVVTEGGTIYLGDGSMGISRPDPTEIPVPHYLAKRGSRFHFWLAEVAGSSATHRAIDHYGETFEILTMEKNERGNWITTDNEFSEEERDS